jgi:hypothetical protein
MHFDAHKPKTLPPRREDVLCVMIRMPLAAHLPLSRRQQPGRRERDMTLCRTCSTVGTVTFDDQSAALLP